MTLHVWVSITVYDQLYKLNEQVSLVTALIEQDHFLYLSSFMDKCFSGNAFKFLIFFNLLTFNKRVLNLAEVSHTCSVLWLAVRRWCHTFMCTCFINSGSRQRKLMISFMVPTKPDWSGLVLSIQNVSYNSEFVNLPSRYRVRLNTVLISSYPKIVSKQHTDIFTHLTRAMRADSLGWALLFVSVGQSETFVSCITHPKNMLTPAVNNMDTLLI